MRHNRLRALLTADQPSLGTHLLSSWPTLVELVGDAGNYDYVEFTAEYAPFHMHDLDNLGRALELKNLGGMIKIEQTQWTHQAMRDRLRLPGGAVRRPAHGRRRGGLRRGGASSATRNHPCTIAPSQERTSAATSKTGQDLHADEQRCGPGRKGNGDVAHVCVS